MTKNFQARDPVFQFEQICLIKCLLSGVPETISKEVNFFISGGSCGMHSQMLCKMLLSIRTIIPKVINTYYFRLFNLLKLNFNFISIFKNCKIMTGLAEKLKYNIASIIEIF